jgi:hypothetical protein
MKLPQHRLRDLFGARGPYFFFYLNSSHATLQPRAAGSPLRSDKQSGINSNLNSTVIAIMHLFFAILSFPCND